MRACCAQTTFEEKGEQKRIRTDVPLLTSLTPYRRARPAHKFGVVCGAYDLQELYSVSGQTVDCRRARWPVFGGDVSLTSDGECCGKVGSGN